MNVNRSRSRYGDLVFSALEFIINQSLDRNYQVFGCGHEHRQNRSRQNIRFRTSCRGQSDPDDPMKLVDPHRFHPKVTAWGGFAAWGEPGAEGLCSSVVQQGFRMDLL